MKEISHKQGDKMYIYSSCFISHGEDDVTGGLATIKEITVNKTLPPGHMNSIFVSFEEIPNRNYNYLSLLKEQDELKEEFGEQIAHPSPDISTPWIQNGDTVNGEIWKDGDVW